MIKWLVCVCVCVDVVVVVVMWLVQSSELTGAGALSAALTICLD